MVLGCVVYNYIIFEHIEMEEPELYLEHKYIRFQKNQVSFE